MTSSPTRFMMRSIFATSTLNKSDDGLPKALGGLPGPARETPSPTSCGSPPLPCETPRVLAATCFNTTRDVTPGTRRRATKLLRFSLRRKVDNPAR